MRKPRRRYFPSDDCRVVVRCTECGSIVAQVHADAGREGLRLVPLGNMTWLGEDARKGDPSDPLWYTAEVECRRCVAPRLVSGDAILAKWSEGGTIPAGPARSSDD